MAEDVTLGVVDRGVGKGEIRIIATTYKGEERIDIRHWYEDKDGSLKPGRAGISMPPGEFLELAKEIDAADQYVKNLL